MSKAARSTIILSVGLVLVVSMAGWLSAQQSPTSAQPPGVSAPAQPDEDITSDIALTRASIQLSCATIDATTPQFVGASHFPPSDPARVEILRGEPSRPHDRLGEIVVDASIDPPPPIEKVEAKLRSEASKLGADVVIVVSDRVQEVGAFLSGPPREGAAGEVQHLARDGEGRESPWVFCARFAPVFAAKYSRPGTTFNN